jgi:hypothetical protein
MVNTFVPHKTMVESLMCLDYKRLGKQRVETKQILNVLRGRSKGWGNHPATRMWRGHTGSLAMYGAISCRVWAQRGYEDNLLPYFLEALEKYPDVTRPGWWGDDRVHLSHQSNLVRKDSDWYGPQFPSVRIDLPYFWPV